MTESTNIQTETSSVSRLRKGGLCGLIAAMAFVVAAAQPARAALQTLYVGASSDSGSIFGTLNLTSGAFTKIANESTSLYSLTVGPSGTLFAGGSDGNLYSVNTSTAALTRVGTVSFPNGKGTPGLTGLVSRGTAGFYGDYINSSNIAQLVSISLSGTSSTELGAGTVVSGTGSGNLAFGANGNLYETALVNNSISSLLSANPSNGATTTVGTGYGVSPYLTIATFGSTLYGIDSQNPGTPAIYTINTNTGVATATGLSVTGLPAGYVFDTVTSVNYNAVPEPTSLSLLAVGALGLLRRRRTSVSF